ncbi:PREDICTED: prostaglandin-H2 D-isomerase [Chrysochloris asiatica]|uniref:Prostaglandin-H2 D-isomerase n=1 Tax=Chrysochloris asiatica TaxID=185453 RepID=A0A9B0TE94_CHRAS|nr:PREDICTED: prostaglandin-H2 D-isomerase [Chrysochloris asiatica]
MARRYPLWMGLVLLGVFGVLQTPTQAKVSVQNNFQQVEFLGEWFTVGLASNWTWFREKKGLSMCRSIVDSSEDGSLNLTFTFARKDKCKTWSLVLQPEGPSGHYTYQNPHWGSALEFSVVETDYANYALLCTEGLKTSGHYVRIISLFSRTQTPRTEFKEKFIALTKILLPFTEDSIVFLSPSDKCMEEHN